MLSHELSILPDVEALEDDTSPIHEEAGAMDADVGTEPGPDEPSSLKYVEAEAVEAEAVEAEAVEADDKPSKISVSVQTVSRRLPPSLSPGVPSTSGLKVGELFLWGF